MAYDPVTSVAAISRELEAGWKLFDQVFSAFGPRQWAKTFGKTWTYAEVPYHLAYFDGMIATFLAHGPAAPEKERKHMRSMGDIDTWNERQLARRPATHRVADSLAAMRQSRDAIRAQLAKMTDADLDRRTWMPLVVGWSDARSTLQAAIIHNVGEYWKLWLRTGKKTPAPSPDAVHLRLGFMMNFMPASMNRELAAKQRFTMTWKFTGPGGGAWTFNVADGACVVTTATPNKSDLTITMKPETFHKLVAKMTPVPLLILSGQMRVSGFGGMRTFAKMFPQPKPETILELVPVSATGS